MILNLLCAVPRYVGPVGLIVLNLSTVPTVIAEETAVNFISAPESANPTAAVHEAKVDLNLAEAVRRALKGNPEFAAYAKEIAALEGAVVQAGLLRNPELAVEEEDIGAGQSLGAQQFVTIRLSQLIELGGKRHARVKTATMAQEIARKEHEAKRLELLARVADSFIDVLAAQERTRLADQSVRLAQTVVNVVAKRVQAGKAPPIEETKAKVALSTARIEHEQAKRDLAASRKRLTLLWGDPLPQFGRALGDITSAAAFPSFEVLAGRVRSNPVALRSALSVEHRKAVLDLEQSRRIPDITVSTAVRHYQRLGENTALLTLSVPLPLFDRNQGNLQEAHHRLDKAVDEQAATDLSLQTQFAQSYEALLAAQNEITVLRDEVLPAAKSAFDVANRGYELGKFSFLETLDAQRTLFENQTLYVHALANYQKLVNELERLTAAPINGNVNPPDYRAGTNL
ncbi:MAG: TolC family protein [Methylococcaceae bacterium]|nr:TolC family protein [Methylococcaceae bacterium]